MTALSLQTCTACAHRWYLARDVCPRCGGDVTRFDSTGTGTVFSVTTQHRAPSRDFPVAPPWRIGLVDLDDGVRVMGHLDDGATIGARVRGAMQDFAGAPVPTFDTVTEE